MCVRILAKTMNDLEKLFKECEEEVDATPKENGGVTWELGLIVTPAMKQAARERDARYRDRNKT